MKDDLVSDIKSVRFTTVRLREGYEMSDVDNFLDRLAAAARAGEPLAPLCAAARFTSVRLRPGYDVDEVDAFLTQVGGVPPSRPEPTATLAEPVASPVPSGVIEEQRGLLDRLLHRR